MRRRQFLGITASSVTLPVLTGCVSDPDEFPVSIKKGFDDSGYTASSTAEDVTEGLDLDGQTMLITGCNSGIGFETMRVLAMRGAHVIGTGRTLEKAAEACARIDGKTTPLSMELTDFNSVLSCAQAVKSLGLPIDCLILNAGISGRTEKQTVNGIEIAFLVNY